MLRSVSIVEARRNLGRLADEVRRTRQPVILTKRGRAVARLVPQPTGSSRRPHNRDPFGGLRGTVEMVGSFHELERAIRSLRREFARSLDRRATLLRPRTQRDG